MGHDIKVLSRDKEVTVTLLDHYSIEHTTLSSMGQKKYEVLTEWVKREVRTLNITRSYNPDIVLSVASPPATHAAKLMGCPNIVFNDSEPAYLVSKLTHPFADKICTPASFNTDLGEKQERYNGYHELAYLHPHRFTPNPDALRSHGVEPDERYSVVRFVSWGATHDVGERGFTREGKHELLSVLSEHGDVYITSEEPLPAAFEEYRLPIPPERMHDLLYFADFYAGDSQTMATEAAILATPAVRCNSFVDDEDMGNFVELEENYELLYSRADETEAISIIRKLVGQNDITAEWERKRNRLVEDKIDVTEYIVELVVEYGGTDG